MSEEKAEYRVNGYSVLYDLKTTILSKKIEYELMIKRFPKSADYIKETLKRTDMLYKILDKVDKSEDYEKREVFLQVLEDAMNEVRKEQKG